MSSDARDLGRALDEARDAVLTAIATRAADNGSAEDIRALAIAYGLLSEKAPAKRSIPRDPPGLRSGSG